VRAALANVAVPIETGDDCGCRENLFPLDYTECCELGARSVRSPSVARRPAPLARASRQGRNYLLFPWCTNQHCSKRNDKPPNRIATRTAHHGCRITNPNTKILPATRIRNVVMLPANKCWSAASLSVLVGGKLPRSRTVNPIAIEETSYKPIRSHWSPNPRHASPRSQGNAGERKLSFRVRNIGRQHQGISLLIVQISD